MIAKDEVASLQTQTAGRMAPAHYEIGAFPTLGILGVMQTHWLRWHLLGWDLRGARGTMANVLLTLLAVLRVTESLASDPGVSWLLPAPMRPQQTS